MTLPLWSTFPFIGVLLSVALMPSLVPRFWRRYHTVVLISFSIPILALSAAFNPEWVMHGFADYVSFVCLLGALYSIGGGIYIQGTPKANPITNLRYMVMGACLASFIGTLGASMVLVRPLLRSNRGRKHESHVLVFFIFIVSNVGGLLTPLGDPPLFLGYLMGVPFWWGMKLFPIWLFSLTALIALFTALDSYFYLNDPDFRGPLTLDVKSPLKIIGRWNIALIPVLIGGLLLPKILIPDLLLWQVALRIFILVLVTYLSHRLTPKQVVNYNHFSWEPFKEVAVIFAGIFATMIPVLKFLALHGASVGVKSPWDFYWVSGVLSAVLDNAPTYASFFSIAQSLGHDFAMVPLHRGGEISEPLLAALSCGSVFFGAMTYLGNGPNLLVKAVAEEERIRMPSFFNYMLWSIGFLLPVLFLAAILFFEHA